MTGIEFEHKRNGRNKRIQEIFLSTVAVAGALTIASVAPNMLVAMKKLGITPKPRQKEYIGNTRRTLIKQGLLREVNGSLELTKRGEKYLSILSIRNNMRSEKSKKWDGKWRVLIFDVAEKRRKARTMLREHIVSAGFVRAQDSVWIYPYPCEELVSLIKIECKIGYELLYMIVDSLEGDERFRKVFGLPSAIKKPIKIEGAAGALLDIVLPERK